MIQNSTARYLPGVYFNRKNFFCKICLWLFLFGLEFDVRFYGPITLKKLIFLIAVCIICYRGIPVNIGIKKSYILFMLGAICLFCYTWIVQKVNFAYISKTNCNLLRPEYILSQVLLLVIFPLLSLQIFSSLEKFCSIQLSIIMVEALIVIFSRLYKPLRMFIYYHFPYVDSKHAESMLANVTSGIRFGFIGGVGASGSWILFIGCVICSLFLLVKPQHRFKYLACYIIILLSLVFVGRTGLYMGVLLPGILSLYSLRRHPILTVKICLAGICIILAVTCYIVFVPDSRLKSRTIAWVGEIFFKGFGEGSTVKAVADMSVPPLTWETFWGTGISSGTLKSGFTVYNDSGYIQTYVAWGLCGAILYYSWIYGTFAHKIHTIRDKNVKIVCLLFLLFIVIVEWKEPFLRKTPNAMVLMTMLLLQTRSENARLGEKYESNEPSRFCDMP